VAQGLACIEPRCVVYRAMLDDGARMQAHVAGRDRVSLPVRPLAYSLQSLEGAGLAVESVTARTIEASVDHWFEFLSAYHEAVLGWVGGSVEVGGRAPAAGAGGDRRRRTRDARARLF